MDTMVSSREAGEAIRQEILSYIDRFTAENGRPPNRNEIARGINRYRGTLYTHLRVLEDAGKVRLGEREVVRL